MSPRVRRLPETPGFRYRSGPHRHASPFLTCESGGCGRCGQARLHGKTRRRRSFGNPFDSGVLPGIEKQGPFYRCGYPAPPPIPLYRDPEARVRRSYRQDCLGKLSLDAGQLWYRAQKPGWTGAGSHGDHIVEQHVHNLDVIHWFTGEMLESASGAGGRLRRVTGNQYDFFEVDYSFPSGVKLHSRCRQINGRHNDVSEWSWGPRDIPTASTRSTTWTAT